MDRREYEATGNGAARRTASGGAVGSALPPTADGAMGASVEDLHAGQRLEAADDPAGADRLAAAVQVAESLSRLLRDLRDEMEGTQQLARDMADRARLLEADAQRTLSLRQRLRAEAEVSSTGDEVRAMAELIDALASKPSDLLIMVKVSEQAERLAAIVRAHERVLRVLEEES